PLRGLGLVEEDEELLVLAPPHEGGVVDDVHLPLLLLLDVRAGPPVAGVLLAIVDGLEQVDELLLARGRVDHAQGEKRQEEDATEDDSGVHGSSSLSAKVG